MSCSRSRQTSGSSSLACAPSLKPELPDFGSPTARLNSGESSYVYQQRLDTHITDPPTPSPNPPIHLILFLLFNFNQYTFDISSVSKVKSVRYGVGKMRRYLRLILLGVCCVCCPVSAGVPQHRGKAHQLWQQGQDALSHRQPDRAIGFYEQSLQTDPTLTRNHMSLAAAHLEKGDQAKACSHLARYVDAHPEHVIVRTHYAELLLRLRHVELSRREFNRFIAMTQTKSKRYRDDHIHCHRRLMEIANIQNDQYRLHLHRGIGLFLLASKSAALAIADGEITVEGLLCKAASELALAQVHDPRQSRPHWYAYRIWQRLGQSHLAQRHLRSAQRLSNFGQLTSIEQRDMLLATMKTRR